MNEDLISLENDLEASMKVMLDLQAETVARQKELDKGRILWDSGGIPTCFHTTPMGFRMILRDS